MEALVELHQTYQSMLEAESSPALAETLSTYLRTLQQLHPNAEIQRGASILLALDYGKWEDGFAVLQQYSSALSGELDNDTRISLLLSKVIYERCDMEFEDDASQTLQTMQTTFSEDERTQIADQILKMVNIEQNFSGYAKRSMLKVTMRAFPEKNNSSRAALPKII